MIVTRQKHIPFHWVVLAVIPWASFQFAQVVFGNTFVFSLRKFVSNPVGLTFILTLPSYISIIILPICSVLSDRIWTRVGRRKPFILASWILAMICLFLLPLMPSMGWLIAVYIGFSLAIDIGAPLEALKQEIVPPQQRGASTGVLAWINNLGGLVFSFVAMGRFDDVRFMGGSLLSGEKMNYWMGGLLLVATFLLLTLGIKELKPRTAVPRRSVSPAIFFKAILDRDLWPVYVLVFGTALAKAGLGPLNNLLYTDQWNYSKQDMGDNIAVGTVFNFFIIAGLTLIADRLNRLRTYQILLCLSLVVQAVYYVYVEFILPTARPSLIEIILFGETLSVIGILTNMVYLPLAYDYVVRDKMGAYVAGSGVLIRIMSILTVNAIGLFVWVYATLFEPGAGEMARVCFPQSVSAAQVQSWLRESGSAPLLTARAWYADGVVETTGACWEIRKADAQGSVLEAQLETSQQQLAAATTNGVLPSEALRTSSARLKIEMQGRADAFRNEVNQLLRPHLLVDGEQVAAAQMQDALVIELSAPHRPGPHLERVLVDLRRSNPEVIDLRTVKKSGAYAVDLSCVVPPATLAQELADRLAKNLVEAAARRHLVLLLPANGSNLEHRQALRLDVSVVEKPVERQFSPVTRAVNWFLGQVGYPDEPGRRVAALARSLRNSGQTEHVGIATWPGGAHGLSVTVLLDPGAKLLSTPDGVTNRLRVLLGPGVSASTVAQARAFYERVVKAASIQNLTVERPVVGVGYTALRYDYMSGYLVILFLQVIGVIVTFGFARWEKKGLIRKLGVEEMAST